MAHQPGAIDAGLPPYAIALARRARSGRLVIYAGAGLSLAEPAGLPTGAQVAEQVHARLRDAFPDLDCVDQGDLVAIADAVVGRDGGEEALRFTAVQTAEFTTATPTYGHCILAELLLEGVLDVLTTNWDNCVERAGGLEDVLSVVTAHDLLNAVGRRVLKIHGCASQPDSLLLTSAHLRTPPSWVTDETRARLGNAVVVFVGIGDVAGYVEQRLKEAITDVGPIHNIRVVSPGIVNGWDASNWSQLVPDLAEGYRIAATADDFLEKLGGAYVQVSLAELAASMRDATAVAQAFVEAATALRKHDALTVLAWTRRAGVVAKGGVSVLNTESMAEAIAALGRLTGRDFEITRDSTLDTPKGYIEVLAAVGVTSASRLQREARNRLEHHRAKGVPEPRFLIGGGIGWGAPELVLPRDIFSEGDASDVVDGPMNAEPTILRAREVLAS